MIEEILKYDNNFNVEAFYKYAESIFSALLKGLMNYDISILFNYLDESIYNKYADILEGYKKMKIKRVFSEVQYKTKMIQSCKASSNEITIRLLLITKYKDIFYHLNGEQVNDGNNSLIEKGHYITFYRDLTMPNSKYIIKEMTVI